MYKAVFQAVLLYGRERWVVTDMMVTMIERFHQRITRRIAGMTKRKGDSGAWEWESVDTALNVIRFWPIGE